MLNVVMLIVVAPVTSMGAWKITLKPIFTMILFTKPLSIATCDKETSTWRHHNQHNGTQQDV
jgi:hypothetical protein